MELEEVLAKSSYSDGFRILVLTLKKKGMTDEILAEKLSECVTQRKSELFALAVVFGSMGNIFGYENEDIPTLEEFAEAGEEKVKSGLGKNGRFQYEKFVLAQV